MKRLILFFALLMTAAAANADLEQLRRAAQAGNVEAQLELGELYEFGFTMPQNTIPAYAWYSIAAERGNAKAAQRRDLLKSKLSAADLAEAERQRAALAPTIPVNAPAPAAAPPAQAPSAEPPPTPAASDDIIPAPAPASTPDTSVPKKP